MAEWIRRQTLVSTGLLHVGSNPINGDNFYYLFDSGGEYKDVTMDLGRPLTTKERRQVSSRGTALLEGWTVRPAKVRGPCLARGQWACLLRYPQ